MLTVRLVVGRCCMDHHLYSSGPSHDSWRGVSSRRTTVTCLERLIVPPSNSFFYSGLSRRKSALSLIWLSLMSSAIISFQWYLWGYSLTFSRTAGKYIGNLDNVVFRNVLAQPSVGSVKVPDLLFAIYQGMFAAIT